ncbi:MAG: HAMP domain-containing histidine kinase [Bacilli bacterium]|nr:HAMP domain-containing histidine kinase [Bacilli bacterium]
MKKLNLSRQLIIITLFSLLLMITLLTLVLPKALEPYFEQNVYTYLDKPLEVMHKDNEMKALDNIVYINNDNNELHITPNYKEVIDIDNENILLSYISNPKGKFKYKGKTYYYSTIRGRTGKGIAITNDFYIKTLRRNILFVTIPIVSIIFVIILVLLLCWSNYLVKRIKKLKLKINNFNDPDFDVVDNKYELDDELKLLDETIDEMKEMILSKEKYEREMYQNISHDFKTPIMVVKSYIEAYKDKIESADNIISITEEEMNKLEKKVRKLLELNKVTYLKSNTEINETIDIIPLIKDKIKKYKVINKDLKYKININYKEKVNGNLEIWDSILDNLLSNMVRYANKEIIIDVSKDNIVFYNDGEHIKKTMLNKIFDSYVKGKDGGHGLGLSIVKKNVELIGYKISVSNKDIGVEFKIEK